jgi:hypothetical protein
MNGINAPKVVECLGSDGHKYRQLAKSGNDDLRQDAVRIPTLSLQFVCTRVCYTYIYTHSHTHTYYFLFSVLASNIKILRNIM